MHRHFLFPNWLKIGPLLFEKPESVNRRRIRHNNGQKKKDKRSNNDIQNITKKTEDQVTRTQLKTGAELRCSWRVYYYKVHTVDLPSWTIRQSVIPLARSRVRFNLWPFFIHIYLWFYYTVNILLRTEQGSFRFKHVWESFCKTHLKRHYIK